MKILIVIPYVGEIYGGTSKIALELAHNLGRIGQQIDLVTTNANNDSKLDVPTEEWVDQEKYRIQYFTCIYRKDFIISFKLIAWIIRNINNYDIVHTHTLFAPIISLTHLVCKFTKTPFILTPHGMLEPWSFSHKFFKKRIYFFLIENIGLRSADAIQVTASPEGANIEKMGFKQIKLIPNGLNYEDYYKLPSPEIFLSKFPELRHKTLILFLGRIDPKKGLDLLASAFEDASGKHPDIHLVIAGPDSIGFLPTVRSFCKKANCMNSVTFTGMLKGELKLSALSAADIYVAPSYSEGFSMSVLEGMAARLPCIITAGCNFPEAKTAGAARVVDANIDAIASALLDYLQHPDQAHQVGTTAREFISQNYTWAQAAHKLCQTYKCILDERALTNESPI